MYTAYLNAFEAITILNYLSFINLGTLNFGCATVHCVQFKSNKEECNKREIIFFFYSYLHNFSISSMTWVKIDLLISDCLRLIN